MKKFIFLQAVILLLVHIHLQAHSFFGYNPTHTVWSRYLQTGKTMEEADYQWQPIIIGYGQKADKGLGKNSTACPVSQLLFGASSFSPGQSLAPKSRTEKLAPLINSTIAPRIAIREHGIVGGIQYTYGAAKNWQIGVRAQLPVVSRYTYKQTPGLAGKSLFGGPVVTDFYKTATDTIEGTSSPVDDFAIRLDFATLLPAATKGPGTQVNLINYNNPNTLTITMNGIDITDKQTTVTDRNAITTVKPSQNSAPTSPFGILLDPSITPAANTATTLTPLSADGATTDARNNFNQSIDYTALGQNTATQSTLWLVPSALAATPTQLTQNARIIANNLKNIIAFIDASPEQLFQNNGILFTDSKTVGVADLQTDLFFNYFFNANSYLQLMTGISFPTGKKIKHDEQSVFASSLGTGGHTSLLFGIGGVWSPSQWFDLVATGSFKSVLSNQAYIPVCYALATVQNFNQYTRATRSWQTVSLGIDAYLHLPTHYYATSQSTVVFGYHLQHKHKDSIHYTYSQVTDVTGNINSTSNALAANLTNRHSHLISIDIMHSHGDQFTFFGGWNRVIHGQNIAQANGWHVGFETSF